MMAAPEILFPFLRPPDYNVKKYQLGCGQGDSMATRRQFLQLLGLGLTAGAAGFQVAAPPAFVSPFRESSLGTLKIALLADSHLPEDGGECGPARQLAAAVAEINALCPPADLVFVAGDLTADGTAGALSLGKQILAALQTPVWVLPGEQDFLSGSTSLWEGFFGADRFSFTHQGVHFVGFTPTIHNPADSAHVFHLTPALHGWLARELRQSAPETPLCLISHAPPYRLFQPWDWWTEGAEALYELLAQRREVFLLHGHVHQNITLHHQNLIFQGLRATAWPLPDVRLGCTTGRPSPEGTGRIGCGWMLLTINASGTGILTDQVWGV